MKKLRYVILIVLFIILTFSPMYVVSAQSILEVRENNDLFFSIEDGNIVKFNLRDKADFFL